MKFQLSTLNDHFSFVQNNFGNLFDEERREGGFSSLRLHFIVTKLKMQPKTPSIGTKKSS